MQEVHYEPHILEPSRGKKHENNNDKNRILQNNGGIDLVDVASGGISEKSTW